MDKLDYQAPEVDRSMDAPELYHARYDGQAPEACHQGEAHHKRGVQVGTSSDNIQPELM